MWWLYLYSRFNFITIILTLLQVIIVFSKEEILANKNLIVSTLPYLKSDDDFEVTTVYKVSNSLIKNKTGDGFIDENFGSIYDGSYSIEIHSKTKTIGLKSLNTNLIDYLSDIVTPSISPYNIYLFQNNSFIKFSHDKHWKLNDITANGYYCDSDNHINIPGNNDNNIIYDNFTNDCFKVFDYDHREAMHGNIPKKKILTIEWHQQNHLNSLRITYLFNKNVYFDIAFTIYDVNDKELYKSTLNTDRNVTQLIIKSIQFNNPEKYKIIFYKKGNSIHTNINNMTPFSIFQIANYFQPSDNDYKSKITSGLLPKIRRPSPFNVFGSLIDIKNDISTHHRPDSSTNNCLNGGYRLKDRCVCPPGFREEFCEKGCGANKFGADCYGFCSMFLTGCRGVYFCSSTYGCTCSAGLTGRFCDQDCPPHTYGANCNQNCSSTCFEKACDSYTGYCTYGCVEGYKSPYCTEKYTAYLRQPPKLVMADLKNITVEIDFEPKNIINNNEHAQLKYYKLLWKDSNEETYHSSKTKQFGSNKFTETIIDLKPGMTYYVGVLIIMDDGTFNENDIVFGQYDTICMQSSRLNEYNYNAIAGNRSIIITWDKVSYSEQDCAIRELLLTINMINHEGKIIQQSYKIIPISSGSYNIQDLVPGYEYGVNFTLRTSMGVLTPSPIFKLTPKFIDEDIEIKNLTAKYEDQDKKIYVSWKSVVNIFGQKDNTFNTATYTIKYKINRIFSCSLKKLDYNWTSIVVGNTADYYILNVMPNSQYIIQVIVGSADKHTTQRENTVYVLTPVSLPTLRPIFEQPFEFTNNSTTIKWKLDERNCTNMNGNFIEFFLELKNIYDNKTRSIKTEKNYIIFNDLEPVNKYELKIFIVNDVGYSPNHFALTTFSTIKNVTESVSDLVIYKMDKKNHTIGLRWSYPDTKSLKQFIISIHDTSSKEDTQEYNPNECVAWPGYYCQTISYLNHSDTFLIKVKAKSLEKENTADLEASITCCNKKNKLPDPPQNLTALDTHSSNVTLQWSIPWVFNGELGSFTLHVDEIKAVNVESCCESLDPQEIPFESEKPLYNYTLTKLKPGSTYTVYVESESTSRHHSVPSMSIEFTTLFSK